MFKGYAVSLKFITHNASYIGNITFLCCNTDARQQPNIITNYSLLPAYDAESVLSAVCQLQVI